jgi:Vacuolar protein sorting-associated protein 35
MPLILQEEHREVVKRSGYLMKRAISSNDLKETLRQATIVIDQLRIGNLSPKKYYELYMDVFDVLTTLEMFFLAIGKNTVQLKGSSPLSMEQLYEAVQYSQHSLTRLYLMITVASVYSKVEPSSTSRILTDLLDMIKAVQHPQRGLFLRYYLSQKMKDKLPDSNEQDENVVISINFIIRNFCEMNRLWVRMQNIGAGGADSGKGKKKRERERQELRILVAASLTRLANLTSLDISRFQSDVLPRVLGEIVACHDRIAQSVLMEAFISVFPLEWILTCIGQVLDILRSLEKDHGVIKSIFICLLNKISEEVEQQRLSNSTTKALDHVASNLDKGSKVALPGLASNADIVEIFLTSIQGLASDPNGAFGSGAVDGTVRTRDGFTDNTEMNPAPSLFGDNVAPSTPSTPSASHNLIALRQATNISSGEAIASLIEIFASILNFAFNFYADQSVVISQADQLCGAANAALGQCMGYSAALAAELFDLTLTSNTPRASNNNDSSVDKRSIMRSLLGEMDDEGGDESTASSATVTSAAPAPAPEVVELVSKDVSSLTIKTLRTNPSMRVNASFLNEECATLLISLLGSLQNRLGLQVLQLVNYLPLMAPLRPQHRRIVALAFLDSILNLGVRISSPDLARRLFSAIAPLIKDDPASIVTSPLGMSDKAQFELEQTTVKRMFSLLGGGSNSVDFDVHFQIYKIAFLAISQGGPARMVITVPALVNDVITLSQVLSEKIKTHPNFTCAVTPKDMFVFAHELISSITASNPEVALQLYLSTALSSSSDTRLGSEFFSHAFLVFEDISDSVKLTTLETIVESACELVYVEPDEMDIIASRCVNCATKLLKRIDQISGLKSAARVYWRNPITTKENVSVEVKNPKNVLATLQKGLRLADSALPASPALFVELVEGYLKYLALGVPSITPKQVTDLYALSSEGVASMKPGFEKDEALAKLMSLKSQLA